MEANPSQLVINSEIFTYLKGLIIKSLLFTGIGIPGLGRKRDMGVVIYFLGVVNISENLDNTINPKIMKRIKDIPAQATSVKNRTSFLPYAKFAKDANTPIPAQVRMK